MLTTAHLLTGAAVGKITGNVFLAIPWLFTPLYFGRDSTLESKTGFRV